jgi:hypothetical protein
MGRSAVATYAPRTSDQMVMTPKREIKDAGSQPADVGTRRSGPTKNGENGCTPNPRDEHG